MKRGFTLIELLSVLVVLGIVGSIIGISVTRTSKEYKFNLCNNMISDIKNATGTWAANNMLILPTKEYDDSNSKISYEDILSGKNVSTDNYHTLTIKLNYLQNNGYIQNEIENPVTKEILDSNMDINIIYKNNKYTYELDESICEVE